MDVPLRHDEVVMNDAPLMEAGLRRGYSVFLTSSVRRVMYDEY